MLQRKLFTNTKFGENTCNDDKAVVAEQGETETNVDKISRLIVDLAVFLNLDMANNLLPRLLFHIEDLHTAPRDSFNRIPGFLMDVTFYPPIDDPALFLDLVNQNFVSSWTFSAIGMRRLWVT